MIPTLSSARIPIRKEPIIDQEESQQLPQHPEAEGAILGGVLVNNHAWFRLGTLSSDDFAKPANRIIFETMALMVEERMDIEPLTLKYELAKRNMLDAVGGIAYVTSLMDVIPDTANIERYVAIVQRLAKKRRGIRVGNDLMRASYDPETEPEDVAATALRALGTVATKEDRRARPLVDVLRSSYEKRRLLADAGRSSAFDCGFETLNEHQVFRPTFILITADRGSGKSGWMTALARNLATNGHPSAMFSLESTGDDIGGRYEAMDSGMPHAWVRDPRPPQFTDAHHQRLMECHRLAGQRGIFVSDRMRYLDQILMEIRRLHAMHGVVVHFVDYVQLVKVSQRFDRDELKYAHIAQEFLATAIDLNVAIVAFSQVNREGGVAYADSIEKAARVRLHFERSKTVPCEVTMSLLKNNEGRTNSGFPFHFLETTQQWGEGTCADNGHGSSASTKSLFSGKGD